MLPSNPSSTVSVHVHENVTVSEIAVDTTESSSSTNSNNTDSDDDSSRTTTELSTDEALLVVLADAAVVVTAGSNCSNSHDTNSNDNSQHQQKRQKKAMPPSKYVTESQRRSVQFPWKLHEMLDDVEECGHTDIVHWLPSGDAFYVRDGKRFVAEIMPLYFSQKFYKSFQRQLNMWGFSKVRQGPNKGAIGNEFFQRNQPDLCCSMRRIKVKGSGKFRKQPLSLTDNNDNSKSNAMNTETHAAAIDAADAANRRSAVDIVMCSDVLYSNGSNNNNNFHERSYSSSSQQPAPAMDNGIAMALLTVLQQASAVQHQQQVPALHNASMDEQSMTAALTLLIQQQQQEIVARQLIARQAKEEETKRSVLLASLMLGNTTDPSTPAPQPNAALMALLRLAHNSTTM